MTERLSDGTIFGPYTIEGLIAAGGMGQVYAARHTVYGNTVALKVLHPALHADEGWRARFNEEGLVGTQLKHPHVLSARELVHNEGRIALVFDLVPGGQTLEKVMSREFRDGLLLVPALQVFLKILQGMDYLHCKSIVHGDLKPENVMIEGDFRRAESWIPKVTDFGTVALIANPVEIDGRPAVVATPRYASPEHLYGVDQIEVRSDIYCLGLILHFLLTGRHASNAQNVRDAAERVMLPVPIVNLVDQPEPLVEMFKIATAIDPGDRYETVRQLAIAVRGVLTAVGADIPLPDVAADLATEVDEERERQRQAAQRKSASQVATEPDPKPKTSYGQQHTPSRVPKPDTTGSPGASAEAGRQDDRTPPMLSREVSQPPQSASSLGSSLTPGEEADFVPVQPEGATSPEPHPAMTRSAPARKTAVAPAGSGTVAKPVQPISAAARSQLAEPAPSPSVPWFAVAAVGLGLALVLALGLVAVFSS